MNTHLLTRLLMEVRIFKALFNKQCFANHHDYHNDSHDGYGYVGFGNLNIHDDDTDGVNETLQYHVMTTASTSTATLDPVIYLNPLFHPEVY